MARFDKVDFPDQYPQHDVAEHEVLLAFNGDSDALAFREWWADEGCVFFGDWLKRPRSDVDEFTEGVCPVCHGVGECAERPGEPCEACEGTGEL